jgi:hypothetical protein
MRCVSSTTVTISRLPQSLRSTTTTSVNPLFCVYYDSSMSNDELISHSYLGPVYGNYYNYISDYVKSDIDSLMSTETWKNTSPQRILDDVTATRNLKTNYMVGDYLPVAVMKSAVSLVVPSYNYLRIPSEVFSSSCSDNVFVRKLCVVPS